MVVRKLIGFFTALVWASLAAAAPSPLPGPVVSVDALDDLIKKQASDDKVSFCNTGHWAATNWFILSEILGQAGTQLYPESMVAWSNAGLPMQNKLGRATVLFRQLLGTGVPK
jgi:hypothetical protein